MKQIAKVWFLVFLLVGVNLFAAQTSRGAGDQDVVYVDDEFNVSTPGWGVDHFNVISEGITALRERGLVYVSPGTYSEYLVVNKSITLEGEDKSTTFIEGNGAGNVISIRAERVTITGFTIQQSGAATGKANIHIFGVAGNHIYNNIIKRGSYGIFLDISSQNGIENNTFVATGTAIFLNKAQTNRIHNNNIFKNSQRGVYIQGVNNDATDNLIYNNNIVDNGEVGVMLHLFTSKNKVYHNNFISNANNSVDLTQHMNRWNETYPIGGNYWSDYTGVDSNPLDGFGDTPYSFGRLVIQTDSYPFINQINVGVSIPLDILVVSSITENNDFDITVTAFQEPIEDVPVVFNGINYKTGSDGKITVTAPLVSEESVFIISATKEGYQSAQQQITVLDTQPQLMINAPLAVQEGATFQVTVTANTVPIENVAVLLQNITSYTNQNGECEILAPLVDKDSVLELSAIKNGYLSGSVFITISNQQPTQTTGWIYGVVLDSNGVTLEHVQICAVPSNGNDNECLFTDELGMYTILLPIGSYTVTAEKEGYVSSQISSVLVEGQVATEINFVLNPSPVEPNPPSQTLEAVDYAIRWGVEQRIVGAEISVAATTLKNTTVYNENLTINYLSSSTGSFTFTVSAPDGTQGTIVAIKIADADSLLNTRLIDLAKIGITFDGENIPMANSFQDLFEPSNGNTGASWAAVVTGENVTIIVYVPHFSEHTITIFSLEEAVNLVTVVLLYCGFGILAAVLFISRFYARPLYRTFFQRRK